MKKTFTCLCLLVLVALSSQAQVKVYNKFWVQFKDKANNTYSLNFPNEFLSQRSLDRRARYNIPLELTDLPLTEGYVQGVQATGVRILTQSKWLNAITIETIDTNILNQIRHLSYVTSVTPVAATTIQSVDVFHKAPSIVSVGAGSGSEVYGSTYNQVSMPKGDYLHEMGFMGEGMVIAVLDAGFENVNNIGAFDSLRMNNRILGTWDFVSGIENVYAVGGHGRNVLSIIAGNLPGQFMGSAPRASYYLFRTEEGATEYKVEEGNWIAAAERADSLGVDMITSSLGYSDFNDTSMNYTYADLNGSTARVTIGADLGARKGILMVNSAGNEGSSSWHYITPPSDGDSVFTIGAVDPEGNVVGFSSRGPASDGAIKPNVSGQGSATAYIDVNGNIATGSGTSYSTPLLAGLTACLWQSAREKNNMEIIQIIQQTASVADNPNDSIGYGIPDYQAAHMKLLVDKGAIYQAENLPVAYPNPFTSGLSVMLYTAAETNYQIDVFDSKGQRVYTEDRLVGDNRFSRVDLSILNAAQPGMYLIRIHSNDENQLLKVVKM